MADCIPSLADRLKTGTPAPPEAGEVVGPQELSFLAGGRATWRSPFGRLLGGFLQNRVEADRAVQPPHSLAVAETS